MKTKERITYNFQWKNISAGENSKCKGPGVGTGHKEDSVAEAEEVSIRMLRGHSGDGVGPCWPPNGHLSWSATGPTGRRELSRV